MRLHLLFLIGSALVATTLAGLLAGCDPRYAPLSPVGLGKPLGQAGVPRDALENANRKAAEALAETLKARETPADARILLTTFTEVDDLRATSTLGRLIPGQISSGLADLGYTPVELENVFPDIRFVPGEGKFGLSRDLPDYPKNHGYAVLSGMYVVTLESLHVNVRVVRVADNAVLAGHDYAIPLDSSLRSLALAPEAGPRPSVETTLGRPRHP